MTLFLIFHVICLVITVLAILRAKKLSFRTKTVNMAINLLVLSVVVMAFFVRIPMDSPEDIFVRGIRCCIETALLFYLIYMFCVSCIGKEPDAIEK